MINKLLLTLSTQLVLGTWICLTVVAQDKALPEKDFGQEYARMSDAELWAEVMKCKNRKELQALVSRIPLSVMAKRAIAALDEPLHDHKFGKLVNRVLWTETHAGVLQRKLLSRIRWQDSTLTYSRWGPQYHHLILTLYHCLL